MDHRGEIMDTIKLSSAAGYHTAQSEKDTNTTILEIFLLSYINSQPTFHIILNTTNDMMKRI